MERGGGGLSDFWGISALTMILLKIFPSHFEKKMLCTSVLILINPVLEVFTPPQGFAPPVANSQMPFRVCIQLGIYIRVGKLAFVTGGLYFDQSQMGSHLQRSFEKSRIEIFPKEHCAISFQIKKGFYYQQVSAL